ncbi:MULTISPECIES: helix-turn-helix domain-containing protein [Staphylococcus]|uniref:helix-turn-helix domain-containing protein n=1 Tax=Staphylococcus TaxID=1279 RepID=UPI000D1E72CD|nr:MULTISPECIES: helix-turn-helix transcriptional regulator [Staphylococcus]KAA2278059.1 helix-turn-helix transcriptional regulator [Staphylococcus sp. GDX7P312P]KAA2281504.1 helix-turn-helix transcriptional regulator [Staphylococcus sp. GDX7P459A]PTK51090.1 XRE family transcriptional regulator [Staphylococcus haemolyticus]TXD08266.1 helix-turn-helix transcriptional regulator [Staphylococcus haemolyticus]UUY77007.1 helix-turn-helix transcriptional regulator [Staphylococcus haemolyticus]
MDLGKNIKFMRKRRGFTQVELSNKTGISAQAISNIERSYSKATQPQLESLSNALNCKISDLIVDDKEVDYEKIMFSDKKAFDALPLEDRMRILERLQEQADFMIERAKKQ